MVLPASLMLLAGTCVHGETQQGWPRDSEDESCFMQDKQHMHTFLKSGSRNGGAAHEAVNVTANSSLGDTSDMDSSAGSGLTYSIGLSKHVHREPVLLGQERSKVKPGHKISYYGKTCLGKEGDQCFSVVYDTGSGNLLIPGDDCDAPACKKHKRYNPQTSETSRIVDCKGSGTEVKNHVRITFGTGDVDGSCVRDHICVGGKGSCVQGDFITSDYESMMPFGMYSFDGVQGLALTDLSQGSSFNLMQNLMDSRKLKNPVFAVFLSDSADEESRVTFGSHLPERMHGSELIWQPVTRTTGYWEVQIKDITINNQPKEMCKDCFVAVDTGTSKLGGPTDVIESMKRKLDVKSDCSNYDELPLLGFQLPNNQVLNLQPRDYVDRAGNDCSVAFMSLDVPPPNGPLFIFGIPFLQKFYTIYDQKNKRVGFAVAKHSYVTDEDAARVISVVQM